MKFNIDASSLTKVVDSVTSEAPAKKGVSYFVRILKDKLLSLINRSWQSSERKEDIEVLTHHLTALQKTSAWDLNTADKVDIFTECAKLIHPGFREWFNINLTEQDGIAEVVFSIADTEVARSYCDNTLIASSIMQFEKEGGKVSEDNSYTLMKNEMSKAQEMLDDDLVSEHDLNRIFGTQKRFGHVAPLPLNFDNFVESGQMDLSDDSVKDKVTVLSLVRLGLERARDAGGDLGADELKRIGAEVADEFELAITPSVQYILDTSVDMVLHNNGEERSDWPSEFFMPLASPVEGSHVSVFNVSLLIGLTRQD